MATIATLNAIKGTFEVLLKFKNALSALVPSDSFAKEVSINDLVEKYFSYEMLPKDRIKVVGKLSPYIPNTYLPVYSPLDFKNVEFKKVGDIKINNEGQKVQPTQLTLNTSALNIPSLVLNPVDLKDGSSARVLWLYPPESNGILFRTNKNAKLKTDQIGKMFDVSMVDKPIPILVDKDLQIEQFLYKNATVYGKVTTAPREHFDIISNNFNPFLLDFFSNCIRPFAPHDGVLAIDARRPAGKLIVHDSIRGEFNILYTVQASVDIPEEIEKELTLPVALSKYVDAIPDRQGLSPLMRAIKDNNVNSLITIGDISWQYCEENKCFASFIPINAADPEDSQFKVTKLAYHWQAWQKCATEQSLNLHKYETKINTMICTNKKHEINFSAAGFRMSKSLHDALLNNNPSIRSSIDWLGISIGRDL